MMMSEEIELKFIVHPDMAATLPRKLTAWQTDYSHSEHLEGRLLSNTYYETADNTLRQLGMGLRVRGENGQHEMTLKTAGTVIGGLHQHPEYNVPLANATLDIRLLPADIWPPECDVDALAQALHPLFSTHFQREQWVIAYHQSLIEIAFDQGEVAAGELSEPILELEMELKAGQTDDLLALSQELAEWGGMRQGSLSKAARGYHLAQGAVPRECRALRMLVLPAKSTIDQAIGAALEHALAHWQYHEELWARGERKARLQLLEAGALMREMLVLVGGVVPRKVTTLFRAALTHLEEQVERETDAEKVCYDGNYLNSKLVLTSWLVNSTWREHMDNKSRMRLMGSYKRFCDVMLDRAMAELRSVFSHPLDADHYQQQLARLQRNINAFLLLSSAYPEAAVESFIAQWRAVEHAIKHLPASGVDSVLESARRQAVDQTPYWLSSASV